MRFLEYLRDRVAYIVLAFMGLAVIGYELYQVKTARAVSQSSLRSSTPAAPARIAAEGRLVVYPGAEVTVSAEIDGKLQTVAVKERDAVQLDQVVAEIDVDEQRAALNEASARVKEATAELEYLEKERHRTDQLFAKSAISSFARDRSDHEARLAQQRKASLLASAARVRTILSKSRVAAPRAGTVTARYVDAGEMVRAGDPLLTITDLNAIRVEAEVGEFDATRVFLGQKVTIRAEGNPERAWRGAVEEIPDTVVPRRLKPLDPANPVDTRVLLVKIKIDEKLPLKLGQRVEVELAL